MSNSRSSGWRRRRCSSRNKAPAPDPANGARCTYARPGRVLVFTAIARTNARSIGEINWRDQLGGGSDEKIDDGSMAGVEPDGGNGIGTTLRAQRSGRDHGTLASQLP